MRMENTVTLLIVLMVMMWISDSSSIPLPGLDLSKSIDDPKPFHLPPYLNPVNKGNVGMTAQPSTRLPPTQQPGYYSNDVGKNPYTLSNYIIKSLALMDANSLKTLSDIINVELKKQSPADQMHIQTESKTHVQDHIQGQIPVTTNIGQNPHLSYGVNSGSSINQQQSVPMTTGSQTQQEGSTDHSYYNNLSNQHPSVNSGQASLSSLQTIGTSPNQQPQLINPPNQPQLNPAYIIRPSNGGGGDPSGQVIPNTMLQSTGAHGQPSASKVETSFDPNRLMESIEAETSQYNPNAFLAKQNYITANQWNFANQIPENTEPGSQTDVEQQKKPYDIGSGQLNFKPDTMLTPLGLSGQKFTFDPDKINLFGSSGFQPGIYPLSSDNKDLPKNMFNADTVNKMLMSYSGQPKQQLNQEDRTSFRPSYDPNTFNRPALNSIPSTYLQFIKNEGSESVDPPASFPDNKPLEEPLLTPSQTSLRHHSGNGFQSQPLSPIHDKDNALSLTNMFQSAKFNPDQINAAQRQFDANSLSMSVYSGRGSNSLSDIRKTKSVRKLSRYENRANIVKRNTSDPQTPSPISSYSNHSMALSSTAVPFNLPMTTVVAATSSTTPTSTDEPLFNPNNVNLGIAQMMNFSPGSLMMGYNQVPSLQNNNMANTAFNPVQMNPMGKFQSGMSLMMSAITGEGGKASNTVSQTALQSNYDQSQGLFNPADVNQAKMSFDLNQQMGFSANSGSAMFDPMKTSVLVGQDSNQSTVTTNAFKNFFGAGALNMMDNSIFTGVFDANKVNQAAVVDTLDDKQVNTSTKPSVSDNMSAFLGMGILGGTGGSTFGGRFDPSDVNTAVFNPNDVNSVQMNFDPSNMLNRNPGYDLAKTTETNFDPTKINDMHMNFMPPFLPVDKNKDINMTSSGFSQYNSEFIPGQIYLSGNAKVFNPNEVNQENMHFSALDIFNSTGVDGSVAAQGSTFFNLQLPNKNSNIPMPVFDPVAVNNMQMNFVPSSALNTYEASLTEKSTVTESTASMSTPPPPTTTNSPTKITSVPASTPNSTNLHI